MLAATSTYAGEAELSLEGRLGGDSNVFRRPEYPKSASPSGRGSEAGYWEIVPRVAVREEKQPLTYELSYQGSRQSFFNKRRLTGWNHRARARSAWLATAADAFQLGGSHFNERRLLLAPDEVSGEDPGDPDLIVTRESDRQRVRSSRADFSYTRSFDARRSLTVDYDFVDIDFVPNSNPALNAVDTRSHTVSLRPSYALNEITTAGLGVGVRRRENSGIRSLGQADSDVLIGDVSFNISHRFSPNVSLSLGAGPSFINTEIFAPDGRKDETNDLSWFAAFTFRREWRKTALDLSYSRFESASGGAGGASIVDQVLAVVNHRAGEHWNLNLIASWNRREQLVEDTPVFIIPDEETTIVRVSGTVRYNITDRASVSGTTQYVFQHRSLQAQRNQRFQVITGFVAFRYTFEPLQF
jgi:hypothetical protein